MQKLPTPNSRLFGPAGGGRIVPYSETEPSVSPGSFQLCMALMQVVERVFAAFGTSPSSLFQQMPADHASLVQRIQHLER